MSDYGLDRVDGESRGRVRRDSLRLPPDMRQELKRLAEPSAWRAWLAILTDWLQIALAAIAIYWAIWVSGSLAYLCVVPLGWLVIGTRMRALATILHEASHRSLAHSRLHNIVMGTVASGWWILQLHWRYFQTHIKGHHVWLGDVERDPDIAQYKRLKLLKQDPRTFLVQNLVQLLVGLKTFVNLPYLLRDRLLPEKGTVLKRGEKVEIACFLLAWTTLLAVIALNGWLLPFVVIWVVPYLTIFQAVNHLIETLEHFPLTWTRPATYEWTRNRKGPWFEQWLAGAHGEGWHRVHHLLPGLAFWHLARAHEILMRDTVYAAFERESGGIFCRGTNGEPPIVTAMVAELTAYQAAIAIDLEEGK